MPLKRPWAGIPVPTPATRDRSAVLIVGLAGLVGSIVLTLLTTRSQVGAIVLAPWVAVLAFELGLAAGVLLSLVAALVYVVHGEHLTWLAASSGLLPLVAVAVGAALIGARLLLSENAYRLLNEELPLATFIETPDGATAYVGPQIEPMTGYAPSKWIGSGLFISILHPADRFRVVEAQQRARGPGDLLTQDYRVITRDGTVRWLRERSVTVKTHRGGQSYRQGFVTDVTDEKETANRLQGELVLRRSLIDSSLDAICLTTREGEIVIANAPMTRFVVELALPREGRIQERLLAIADRFTEPERYREAMHRIAADPDTPSRDEFELRESGRCFQGFTSPVIDEAVGYLGRIWTLREVTEERRLERQQQNFVATVSHELRTPLTSILGYSELLRETLGRLEARPERYIAVIARNAERLRVLVDELLFVAQVDAGRFALDLAEVELAELAAASYEAALPVAQSRDVDLRLVLEARPILTADAARLTQAIDNLVSNALKFTPEKGRVDMRVTATERSATLAVGDTGIGIPEAELARIGERFFRSSTAGDRAIGGTGLGMAIVNMIVDAHQGRVYLESEPGRGTTVTVRLPRLRA